MKWGRSSILSAAGLGLVVLATGCGSSTNTNLSATTNEATIPTHTPAGNNTAHYSWTGLGAPLRWWESGHPRSTQGCSAGKCFGSEVQISPKESRLELHSR